MIHDITSFFIDPFTLLNKTGKCMKAVKEVKEIAKCLNKEEKVLSASLEKIQKLEKDISSWLGSETKLIKNKYNDPVFLSKDGTRRVRFDLNHSSPHKNPHGHVEQFSNGKWNKSGPIYPQDVPHN